MEEQEAIQRLRARDQELARVRATLPVDRGMQDARSMAELVVREVTAARPTLAAVLSPEQLERSAKLRSMREAEEVEAKRARDQALASDRAALRDYRSAAALDRAPPAMRKLVSSGEFKAGSMGVSIARKWARGGERGLALMGGVGTGKSVAAACAMAEHAQSSEESVTWHRPNDFVSGVLHKYDEKAPRIGKGLVVIDDLGRETKGDFEEALVVLIDDTLTRFVLTTNLTMDELRARYGERLLDRLGHECQFVAMSGRSQRRKP